MGTTTRMPIFYKNVLESLRTLAVDPREFHARIYLRYLDCAWAGDCSALSGVTVSACQKCPDEVKQRLTGKKPRREAPVQANTVQFLLTPSSGGTSATATPGSGSISTNQWGSIPLFQVAGPESMLPRPSTTPDDAAKLQNKVDKVNSKLASFFFECALPFNVIEHPAFREFCGVLS